MPSSVNIPIPFPRTRRLPNKKMEILRNSVFVNLICRAAMSFYRAWPDSLTAAFLRSFSDAYEYSRTKVLWDGFAAGGDCAEFSVYQSFLNRADALVKWFGKALENSLLYKLLTALKDCYLRLSSGSLVLGAVNRVGLRRWLFVAFALYLPIEYTLRDVLHLGIASLWEEAFIAAALLLVLWRGALDQDHGAIKRASTVEVSMLLFMCVGLVLMLLNMPYPSIALAGYRAQVEYMVWFFLILRLIDSPQDAKFLIYAFTGVVFIMSLHGIYQYIIAVPIPAGWVSSTEIAVRTRVFSITGSPNIFGSMLIFAAPVTASLMYYAEKPLHKLLFLCATGIFCLCDLFTFSKGSWIGLVLAVVIFAMFADKRLLALMGAAASAVLVAFPSVTNRITYLFTSDYAERSALAGRTMRWETGMKLLKENNPALGFGLGRFGGAVAMNNQVLDKTETFSYFYMDNYYLKTLVEMGYVGLFFYLVLLLSLVVLGFRACAKGSRDTDRGIDPLFRNVHNDKLICVGAFSGLCAVLAHCYYENIFEEPYMMAYFWGISAALMYLGFFADRKKGEQQ